MCSCGLVSVSGSRINGASWERYIQIHTHMTMKLYEKILFTNTQRKVLLTAWVKVQNLQDVMTSLDHNDVMFKEVVESVRVSYIIL